MNSNFRFQFRKDQRLYIFVCIFSNVQFLKKKSLKSKFDLIIENKQNFLFIILNLNRMFLNTKALNRLTTKTVLKVV